MIRVQQSYVSSHHASLRWTERKCWELKDLQSKNGTYVNRERIAAGEKVKLELGDEIGFGSLSEAFVMEDVSPPRAMLVALEGEFEPIFLDQALIGLPSLEQPDITLFQAPSGQWQLDSRDLAGPLEDGDQIRIGQQAWRCCLPTPPDDTDAIDRFPSLFALADVDLELNVSRDEEQIELSLHALGRPMSLGVKACYYLLLTLGRCRLHRDLPPAAEVSDDGWISVSSLLDLLRVSEQRLNVDIFRIRQELRAAGVVDAASIVERQPPRRLLRLGTSRIDIRLG
jgi:FHA domain